MKMGRDVFGNGRRIDETLERFVFEKTALAPEKRLQMKKSTPKKKGQKKWDKGDYCGRTIYNCKILW